MPENKVDIQALVAKLLEHEVSPEVLEIRKMILRRIATESDIRPSRIPAPMNITQVGGTLICSCSLTSKKCFDRLYLPYSDCLCRRRKGKNSQTQRVDHSWLVL